MIDVMPSFFVFAYAAEWFDLMTISIPARLQASVSLASLRLSAKI
jgi:hypothetical protein